MTRAVCSLVFPLLPVVLAPLLSACPPDEARTLPPGAPLTPPSARPSPDPPPAVPLIVEDAGKPDAADAAASDLDAGTPGS